MKKSIHLVLLVTMLLALMRPSTAGEASALEQNIDYLGKAQQILQTMSVEERVGQVFLVSFTGPSAPEDSQIIDLVKNKHIGGVVLRQDNDNFTGPENTTTILQQLIIDLQTANWDANLATNYSQTYTPLLIGIRQEGNLYPGDQILNGMTILPNEMTIGATWDPNSAQSIGSILGSELNALGVNLLLGPSLDVLDLVHTGGVGELGVRTFGGEPYWVGKMGQAYIRGVHEGSDNRVAVVATHFPGIGSSDRQPNEEIATVRSSLEQLKNVELAPFFAVTNTDQDSVQIVDGLLLTHTRYQGFQGNILTSTKPISFDSTALDQIMALPELSQWRSNGGLIISDDLGSQAIRKFVDPMGTGFDARQVARNALKAGNDMLYLGNILASGDPDTYTTVVRTIDNFVQKYNDDSAFHTRVDQAVVNILMLKLKLYPSLKEADVLPKADQLNAVGQHQNKVGNITQQAVTLISPSAEDINSVLPNPPEVNDKIVIISDSLTYAQCSTCDSQTLFPALSLLNSLIRLYGSGSGDPIYGATLQAFTFENLRLVLEKATGGEDMQVMLNSSTWIIFAFTDLNSDNPAVTAFRRLYDERPDLVKDKKIVGMAFNEPYSLDATDISKFAAYYAFYSKIPDAYDIAARVLLQELTPSGKLPVSVPGIGYDLRTEISPDPTQIIPLIIEAPVEQATPVSTPPTGYSQPLLYKAGDTIPVKAGVIVDHNGNPVPDGTKVNFVIDTRSTSGTVEQLAAETVDGYARVMYVIPSIGSLELRATSDPAMTSQILRLDITDAGGVVTSFEPTIVVTQVVQATPTDIPPTPTPQKPIEQRHGEGRLVFSDWLWANLLIFGVSFLFNRISINSLSKKWSYLTIVLLGLGGYLGYLYLAMGLPGSTDSISGKGTLFVLISVAIGMTLGLVIGLVLFWFSSRQKKSSQKGNN